MPGWQLLSLALLLSSAIVASNAAFTFSLSTPTQCDNLSISWTGGQAPFYFTIWPVFGTPTNISIPANAFANGRGSFKTPLPVKASRQFVATMSDASGFNAGGTTQLLTAGSSLGGTCNTDVDVDFSFNLDSALVQCRQYEFNGYVAAKQPVTIYAIIPGGQVLTLQPPVGDPNFEWTANAAAGTPFIFSIVDAAGRQGGSSDVKIVGASDVSSCLSPDSPSTTSNPPTASTSVPSASSPASSQPPPDTEDGGQSKPSVGLIAGTILGAIVLLASIGSMVVFCVRRRLLGPNFPYQNRHSRMLGSVDLLGTNGGHGDSSGMLAVDGEHAPPYSGHNTSRLNRVRSPFDDPEPGSPSNLPPGHRPEPFPLTSPTATSFPGVHADDQSECISDGRSRQTSGTNRRTKAAMAGVPNYAAPSRFILHTDLDEPMPDVNGVIELPPQYSEGRRPIAIPIAGMSSQPSPLVPSIPPPPPPAPAPVSVPRSLSHPSTPISPAAPSLSISMDAFSDVFSDMELARRPSRSNR